MHSEDDLKATLLLSFINYESFKEHFYRMSKSLLYNWLYNISQGFYKCGKFPTHIRTNWKKCLFYCHMTEPNLWFEEGNTNRFTRGHFGFPPGVLMRSWQPLPLQPLTSEVYPWGVILIGLCWKSEALKKLSPSVSEYGHVEKGIRETHHKQEQLIQNFSPLRGNDVSHKR